MARVLPPSSLPSPAASTESRTFVADRFSIDLGVDWTDRTAYVLMGPEEHDLQHTITIATDDEAGDEDLLAYAYPQVDSILETLKGCRCQARGLTRLDCGVPAYFAAFVWWPSDERRVYQEVWFVLHEGAGYRITASFTRKTRKTLGPAVRRAVHGFIPGSAPLRSTPPPSSRA